MSFGRVGSTGSRGRSAVLAAVALLGLTCVSVAVGAPRAAAEVAVPAVLPSTVSADILPTVQVNGVVWDQVIVGDIVYVTGKFTSARPAGAAAGTSETARGNLLAYNITTGVLVSSWAPTLNAQGRAITASADGSRIYVGGDFTSASGVTRNRVAAFTASTGAVVTSFDPNANSKVNDLVVSGSSVYLAGNFTVVATKSRTRLAAVDQITGALTSWAPTANRNVMAIVAPAGSNKIVVGGFFDLLNGVDTKGMGALDATSGQSLPWLANQKIVNWGADAAIWSLTTNGQSVFGTGMTYLVNGLDTGNFEGTFSADVATGSIQWVTGCRGDHYDAAVVGEVVYDVSHTHDCANSGGNVQTQPWTLQYANAWSTAPAAGGATNGPGAFEGEPKPDFLHWIPTLSAGTYTGQSQAAWTIEGNSKYVVIGGEFPKVNNVAQSGLARFAVREIAPNRSGPQACAESTPVIVGIDAGTLRVSARGSWDRDDKTLTYEFLRGASTASAVVMKTLSVDATWWARPNVSFTDTTAAPGSTQRYQIRITDPKGNTCTTTAATAIVPLGSGSTMTAYRTAVQSDSPDTFWRLGESSGTTAYDRIGSADLKIDPAATRGTAGSLLNEADAATTFPGTGDVPATTTGSAVLAPAQLSVETWIKTTTATGGKILGFGDSSTGVSSAYDRHMYMSDDGTVSFGVYPGDTRTVQSSTALNDGNWHHLVGSVGVAGLKLFVDGRLVDSDSSTTSAESYAGFWRLGGDNLNGWPRQPSSLAFAGQIDETAIYPTQLTLDQVRAHYLASGRPQTWANPPVRPSDPYGAAVWDSHPTTYLRLGESAGSVAQNRMTAEPGATYSAGVTLGATGSPAGPADSAIELQSGSARAVGSSLVQNPQIFSLEVWFSTTTSSGGRLIGFGNSQDESSTGYDRHAYMLDSGQLRYGVYTGDVETFDSPLSYNDGAWHHLVITQVPGAQKMYVDGQLVASGSSPFGQDYAGYWRLGSDNIWDGASSKEFRGSLDEAAIYESVLTSTDVLNHWAAAGETVPPANQPPTAAFTSSAENLTASFNGSSSTDRDGTVVSWAWDFGDGTTGAGATATRTYAAAGVYSVKLTVTDDDGSTSSVTSSVTVTTPAIIPLAADTFARSVVSGWGTADLGGLWTVVGGATNFSVAGSAGKMSAAAGTSRSASLNSILQTSSDMTADVSMDKSPTGGGAMLALIGRRVNSTNDYRAKLKLSATGAVTAQITRTINNVETVIQSATVPGVTYAPNDVLRVRFKATGVGSTELSAKVWKLGSTEPAAWLLQASDTTATLQVPGSVGLWFYVSASATAVPVTLTTDNLGVLPTA